MKQSQGSTHPHCSPTPRQKYEARDFTVDLAVMSRPYNDYVSIPRDSLEKNLNSVNLPEFHSAVHKIEAGDKRTAKDDIRDLADYERRCAMLAAQTLLDALESTMTDSGAKLKRNRLVLFLEVTQLYADIYLANDLTNLAKDLVLVS
jgi:hypothetical protein